MALAWNRFCPLLFLVLWAAAMVLATEMIPPGFTRFEWFKQQHWQFPKANFSNPNVYCNNEMAKSVNKYITFCKKNNDFLHDQIQNIVNVCQLTTITCKNGMFNCHNSSAVISITKCNLIQITPTCSYQGTVNNSHFVVACNPRQPNDTQKDPWLPVHLD
ncbi:ribonuclease 7-like [Dromiciops gliroides]|uniref:ribonuclease 7-like n=1 Tax=Dromiciops gliroides TaxID=33562 RepID=UPI001CC654EC|nr:ribonuclease 7-like [Dromiciops gliroides]